MMPNKKPLRVGNVRLTRQIERLHRLFFPADIFRYVPRTTSQKAALLYRKGLVFFTPQRMRLTTKAHADYIFKNGMRQKWNALPAAKRAKLVQKLIQQLNPRGKTSAEVLATQLMLLSAFIELKNAMITTRHRSSPVESTQFTELTDKAIQYAQLITCYRGIAAGLRNGTIHPVTGKITPP